MPDFRDRVSYIEEGVIYPLLAATHSLDRIAEGQRVFREKRHPGKIGMIPQEAVQLGS